jgi:hypothetical protein
MKFVDVTETHVNVEIKRILKSLCYLKHTHIHNLKHIQGVFEVEVFLLTCDGMCCSKEF